MYEKAAFLAGIDVRESITLACGFSLTKIRYADYPKRFINRMNEVYVFLTQLFTCYMLGNFCMLPSRFKIIIFKKYLRSTTKVLNILDPDQARRSVVQTV